MGWLPALSTWIVALAMATLTDCLHDKGKKRSGCGEHTPTLQSLQHGIIYLSEWAIQDLNL